MIQVKRLVADGIVFAVHPWKDAGTGHGDGCAFLAAVYAAAVK